MLNYQRVAIVAGGRKRLVGCISAWRPCRLASVTTTRVMGYARSASVEAMTR